MTPGAEIRLDSPGPRESTVEAPLSVVLALAAPALVWLVAAAALLLATLGGYRALAAPADLTLPEAAALRDEAEVLRQIRHGVDPNVPGRVRRGVIRDEEYLLTPLVAATAARHGEVVRLLMANGADLNNANFQILVCIAQENGAADIVSFLNEHAPAPVGARPDCDNVHLPL